MSLAGPLPTVAREFIGGLNVDPPWDSIVDFAMHKDFCGRRMYPRQLTALKLIYLETENFTQYDWDVIGEWSERFKDTTHPIGVPPDIFDRIKYLKDAGFHHFTHVIMVGGRRGSKGVIGGILGAERMAFLYSIGDWQSYFGFIPGTVAELAVVATNQSQAAKRQFRDVRLAVQKCEYLRRDLKNPRYCVDTETEILTRRGWLRYDQVREGDETLGLTIDGVARWTTVNKVSLFPGRHEMVRWKSRGHDSLTTPDHRWLAEWYGIKNVVRGYRWTTTEQLGQKTNEAIVCARALADYPEQKYSDALVELVGWYWTEGHLGKHGISIAQSPTANPEKWASIQAALVSCFGYAKAHGDGREFYVGKKEGRAEQIWQHAPGKDKQLSLDFVLSLTKAQLKLFVDTSILADGHQRGNEITICQKRKESLDVFQIACQLLGHQTNLRLQKDGKWWLSVYGCNRIYPAYAKQAGQMNTVDYEGIVWCPTTDTGTWLARREGKVYFTGNTDFSIQTPWDRQYIDAMRADGVAIDPDFSSLYAIASSAVSTAQRGGAGIVNMFDEFAHVLMGSGSVKSGEEIYEAMDPSLDQFGVHAMRYIVSSPFCLEPSTRVLTEDLQWVPVGTLQLGDKLIGFDEYPSPGRGGSRTWQPAEVVETSIIQAPRKKIIMASGKEITCTGEHLWLTRRGGGMGRGHGRGLRSQSYPQNWCWIKTDDLREGDHIKTIGTDPWETDESREAGYLAGFFDGEGHVTSGTNMSLGYSQNFGSVQASVERMLKDRDYEVRTHIDREGRMARSRLGGGLAEVFRFLGTIRPERLLMGFPGKLYGRSISSRLGGGAIDTVVSIQQVDDGPVVALGTSTHTLVAEGLMSHNTMVGKFYDLYKEGSVLLDEYLAREGMKRHQGLVDIMDDDPDESEADPSHLVLQFPSWELYRDWEKAPTIPLRPGRRCFPPFRNPVQWPPEGHRPESIMQRKRKLKNPAKFAVEREAQFATVQDAYLDPQRVEAMFNRPWWYDHDLCEQEHGKLAIVYRGHGDPSKSNANFGFAIAHLENSPCDRCGHIPQVTEVIGSASGNMPSPFDHHCPQGGHIWPHVIIDRLHVWKPENYPGHTLDYELLREEIVQMVAKFPSMKKLTYDQANSIGFISHQKRVFPQMRVYEVTFTPKENYNRFEKFKSAVNMGLVHCLSGDTRVITREGVRSIRDLAGGTHRLLTTQSVDGRGGGVWVDAPVFSAGSQELFRITVRRNGVDKVIRATPDHRWFVRHTQGTGSHRFEVLTRDLRPGQKLSYCYAQRQSRVNPSPIGVAHGFTFGDGSRNGKNCSARLCGEKDKVLLPYFDMHKIVDREPGNRLVLGLPRFFKDKVDLEESPSYLYGWLAGYVAADGHVTHDGRVELDSNFPEHLEHVRAVCNILGIHTTSIRTKPAYGGSGYTDASGYAINLDRGALTEEFFIIDAHRRRWVANREKRQKDYRGYTVVSVEKTGESEEVFCAHVDRTHSFVLEDNILTGNSYKDTLFEDGRSLLELELKFLKDYGNKVDKLDFGPVTTKDLADAVMVCTVDLLSDHLDRWYNGTNVPVFGSTNVAGIQSGREIDRAQAMGILSPTAAPGHTYSSSRADTNRKRLNDARDAAAARRSWGDSSRVRGNRSSPSGGRRNRW